MLKDSYYLGITFLNHVERDPSSISGYILSALFFKFHKLLKGLQNSLTLQKTWQDSHYKKKSAMWKLISV